MVRGVAERSETGARLSRPCLAVGGGEEPRPYFLVIVQNQMPGVLAAEYWNPLMLLLTP